MPYRRIYSAARTNQAERPLTSHPPIKFTILILIEILPYAIK